MENQHRALLFNPHPQAGAALGHFHIGVLPGGLIPHHAVAAAKSEQQDLAAVVGEDRITLRMLNIAAGLGLHGVKFIEGFVAHLLNTGPLLAGGIPLRAAARQRGHGDEEKRL